MKSLGGVRPGGPRKQGATPRIAVLTLAFLLVSAGAALSEQQIQVSPGAQPVHVLVGKSVVVNSETRLKRVLSSNPTVIEAVATTPTQVVLEARAPGSANLILWDEAGNSRMLDVTADLDVSGLRTAIERAYPGTSLEAQADGGRIILSGNVPSPKVAEDLVKMAGPYSKDVIDSFVVEPPHDRQILLEVKFAEVDRTKLDQFGVNIFSTGATNTIGTVTSGQFSPVTGSSTNGLKVTGSSGIGTSATFTLTDLLNIFLFRPDINLGATIKALQEKTVLQILAQPNLLALNGQKASFLAGGEFPFPVVQGGANVGAVTIQFRPFGVRLDFTGYIEPNNVVRLQVAPEVSSLDFTNAVTIAGFTVPAISTRRAETEIELKDGQSFGIAGLLDQRLTAQLNKIPGIGDIPILGELFKSRSNNRSNSELMVLVTPHIVDPVTAGAQAQPPPGLAMPYLKTPDFDKNLPGRNEMQTQPAQQSPQAPQK